MAGGQIPLWLPKRAAAEPTSAVAQAFRGLGGSREEGLNRQLGDGDVARGAKYRDRAEEGELATVAGGEVQLDHDRVGVGGVGRDRPGVTAHLLEQRLELRITGQLQLAAQAVQQMSAPVR